MDQIPDLAPCYKCRSPISRHDEVCPSCGEVAANAFGGWTGFNDSIEKQAVSLGGRALRHTTAVYRFDQEGLPDSIGSGVLLRAHGHHFLVSAAHVFDLVPDQIMIGIPGTDDLWSVATETKVSSPGSAMAPWYVVARSCCERRSVFGVSLLASIDGYAVRRYVT